MLLEEVSTLLGMVTVANETVGLVGSQPEAGFLDHVLRAVA